MEFTSIERSFIKTNHFTSYLNEGDSQHLRILDLYEYQSNTILIGGDIILTTGGKANARPAPNIRLRDIIINFPYLRFALSFTPNWTRPYTKNITNSKVIVISISRVKTPAGLVEERSR